MKKAIIASACILALSAGGAFAQSQPAPGASSEGNVGPGATRSTTKHMGTGPRAHVRRHVSPGATTGMATSRVHRRTGTSANPSSEGNVGPGTNNLSGPQPGGR
jgi:hypothetical protein